MARSPRMAAAVTSKTPNPDASLSMEVATTGDGSDITERFVGLLRPMRDSLLAARGADLKLYDEVKRDDRVFTALQQRRLALISKPWTVTPGGDDPASQKAAAALEADLQRLGWDRITNMMWWGHFWGFAVGELIWETRSDEHGTRWTWRAIKARKPARFRFAANDETGAAQLRLITAENQFDGVPCEPRKFWTFAAGEDADDYPYGLGLAHWLYWPVYFKRISLKYWAQAVEKYGAPTAKGSYPNATSEAGIKKLMVALRALHQDAGVVVPEGADISLIETARGAGADQAALYKVMDTAIASIITGQATTIEAASNRAQTDTHKDIRDELIQADSDLLSTSFQAGPLTWWTQWNFPGAQVPWVGRQIEDEKDQGEQAETDTKLKGLGWELTEEAFIERYGDGYVRTRPDQRSNAGQKGAGIGDKASFAESDIEPAPTDSIALAAEEHAGEWEAQIGPLVSAVRGIIAGATSLEDVLKQLPGVDDPEMTAAFAEALSSATLQARSAGAVAAPLSAAEARQKPPPKPPQKPTLKQG
jgi:phage gp29-like protein